jgi:Protein of unknown function (DUF3987)
MDNPCGATTIYQYLNADGSLAVEVIRRDLPSGRKEFLQRVPNAKGSFDYHGPAEPRPLFGLDRLAANPDLPILVCEGEKAAEAAQKIWPSRLITTTSSGGAKSAAKADWKPLNGRKCLIWPDADAPGLGHAHEVIKHASGAGAALIKVIDPFALASALPGGLTREPPKGWDAADAVGDWHGRFHELADVINANFLMPEAFAAKYPQKAPDLEPSKDSKGAFEGFEGKGDKGAFGNESRAEVEWPRPKPLPDGLLPVAPFDAAFLPEAVAPYVTDIADRMQCPPDFVAIPMMVALGSVIGRKIAVRPQRKTDWFEVPNLWGLIVGRPGVLKSPAMQEALKFLHRLEADARKANEEAAKEYELESEAFKLRKETAHREARAAMKDKSGGGPALSGLLDIEEPKRPRARRYVINDATYESLGEILADNPNGVLAFRDELVSLLKYLDREENSSARGFFLTAWGGRLGYTFDRIIRGRTHNEAACLSLVGSTQPGRLAGYIRQANIGGVSDDGLIQRFGLLVWPDQSPEWRDVDRFPNSDARIAAWQVFERLDKLQPDEIRAEHDQFEPVPFLRFDEEAQSLFNEWRGAHEIKLRSGELAPGLESHLAKYRKLIPALALINHLADGGSGPIGETAVLRALALAEYLETHAQRAYAAGSEIEISAAKAILGHIRKGDLHDGFTSRDIQRKDWANLSDRANVQSGLELLCDLDWLHAEKRETGGRPSVSYRVNPTAQQ